MGPISIIDSDNPSLRVFARAPSAWNDFFPHMGWRASSAS